MVHRNPHPREEGGDTEKGVVLLTGGGITEGGRQEEEDMDINEEVLDDQWSMVAVVA